MVMSHSLVVQEGSFCGISPVLRPLGGLSKHLGRVSLLHHSLGDSRTLIEVFLRKSKLRIVQTARALVVAPACVCGGSE